MDCTLVPNYTAVAFKIWPYGQSQKSPKMVIFGKNLPLGENSGVSRKT